MKTLLLSILCLHGFVYAQIKPTDCNISKLIKYENGITDTIIVKAKYIAFGKLSSFPELDQLSKKGMLSKKNYLLAIQFQPSECNREYYMPLYTKNWKNGTDIFSMKNSGKYFNYTCVFYRGFSEGRYPFFLVISMNEIKK